MEDFKPIHPLRLRSVDVITYPAVVFVIASLLILGLCIFIIPTYAEVLTDITEGQEQLPKVTRLLLSIADFLTERNGFRIAILIATYIAEPPRYHQHFQMVNETHPAVRFSMIDRRIANRPNTDEIR